MLLDGFKFWGDGFADGIVSATVLEKKDSDGTLAFLFHIRGLVVTRAAGGGQLPYKSAAE